MNEEKEFLISVIVPVYNAEAFIDRAVKSVLCQMNGSIELILVDDGSTDHSGAICDRYAADNQSITVLHKENGGTSSAKNMGILAAKGRYITFMDSDDFIDNTAYSEIIDVICQNAPDCIDFGWRYIRNDEVMPPAFHKLPKETLLDEKMLRSKILPPLLNLCDAPEHFVFDFCCNKVFKGEIIRKFDVLFDVDKRVWEDRTFLLRCLKYCRTYYAMDRCFYNYVYVPGSLSQRYDMDFFRIILENFRHYSELFGDEFDFDTQYANNYWCLAIEKMIFRSLEQKENKEQIRKNILKTLTNEQVIHWYDKRELKNKFERKMSCLVVTGKFKRALFVYIIKNLEIFCERKIHACSVAVKRYIKRMIGRQ